MFASLEAVVVVGDKIQAKKIAKENGLPIIEGSLGGVKDIKEAKELCKKNWISCLDKSIRWRWWKRYENCK